MRPLKLLFAAALALAATTAHADPAMKNFKSEFAAAAKQSQESKRGIVFHVNGAQIPGVVKEVLEDAVIVANQQHGRIVIRIDRIDAVEAD